MGRVGRPPATLLILLLSSTLPPPSHFPPCFHAAPASSFPLAQTCPELAMADASGRCLLGITEGVVLVYASAMKRLEACGHGRLNRTSPSRSTGSAGGGSTRCTWCSRGTCQRVRRKTSRTVSLWGPTSLFPALSMFDSPRVIRYPSQTPQGQGPFKGGGRTCGSPCRCSRTCCTAGRRGARRGHCRPRCGRRRCPSGSSPCPGRPGRRGCARWRSCP